MKISRTKLHQIIKEEVASLVEAPNMGPFDAPGDKTAEIPAAKADPRAEREREIGAAKQATPRKLTDPKRLSIVDFDSDVRDKLLETYSQEAGITADNTPIGAGEFGIVYKGENPEWGPVAIKFTLSGQEINAYRNIKTLKDGLESRDPEVGNVLPEILDISTIVSPPVGPEGQIRRGRTIEKPDGEKYKVFVVQMEFLEKLDPAVRSDIFGPNPVEPDWKGQLTDEAEKQLAADSDYRVKNADVPARIRNINEYLTIENIASALEGILGPERWEKVLGGIIGDLPDSAIEQVNEGPRGSLPVKDPRAFPPLREIEKGLGSLRKAYLESEADNHLFAMRDIHKLLARQVSQVFGGYLQDDTLSGMIEASAGMILPAQMAANVKLPQYDPEEIERDPGLRSQFIRPTKLQKTVSKNFYNRLKKLEKYHAQYGDLHASNVMQRENGDLVVGDVGLFLFGRKGERGYAGQFAERLQQLAGII